MAEKIINTRIQLKYDGLSNWTTNNPTLKAGEMAIVYLGSSHTETTPDNGTHPIMFKVGPGAFNSLPWASALAADVYAWAKCSHVELDGQVIKFHNNDKANPVHSIDLSNFVLHSELTTALANYYTKNDVDTLVSGKLHTESEIKGYAAAEINRLIGAADDEGGETIQKIGDLVDYVEKNAGSIAQLVTDVGTANTNASNAVTTANNAASTANSASTVAGEAKELAQDAMDAASDAKTGAAASASAAAKSATDAATAKTGAETAKNAAVTAQGKAELARDEADLASQGALTAKNAAVTAQGKAEDAQEAAEGHAADALASKDAAASSATTASEKASDAAQSAADALTAKNGAVDAKTAAEAARDAAVNSNTSATAIANQAKSTADAAKSASDAATAAVAGLHGVATSGSIYDVEESMGTYLVFYCGNASTLID